MIHGQMDEDSKYHKGRSLTSSNLEFYFGETLSGRTGLVPSNYVEQIPDYVLLQNASRAPSPSTLCANPSSSTGACCSSGMVAPRSTQTATTSQLYHYPPPSTSLQHSPAQTVADAYFANGIAPPPQAYVHTSSRPASPSFTLNVPPHHTQITHDFSTGIDSRDTPIPDSVCPYPPIDVSKVKVQEIKHPDKPRCKFLINLCSSLTFC